MKKWHGAIRGLVASLLLAACWPATLHAQVRVTIRLDLSTLAGTAPDGRPLLYAPDPQEPGSSVVHWDPSATPDLLMEPFAHSLPFLDLDITPAFMEDIGWSTGLSQFNIFVQEELGEGFTDSRPFPGAPGNNATTLGEARTNLFLAVLGAWAETLASPVNIDVMVMWVPLFCDPDAGVAALAGARPFFVLRDDSPPQALPFGDIWYPAALAEAFFEQDLTGSPLDDGGDIVIVINSAIDDGCFGPGTEFYYGLDGQTPADLHDLASTILHELGHGLGMYTTTDLETGEFFLDRPFVFDLFTLDLSRGKTWDQMTAAERIASASNDRSLVWNGEISKQAAAQFLRPGMPVLEVTGVSGQDKLPVAEATFGAPLDEVGVSGELACTFDGFEDSLGRPLSSPRDACEPLLNAAEITGKIAIVNRGTCPVVTKAKNAQEAGAIGVIVVNLASNSVFEMQDTDPSITIPAVMVGRDDGFRLKLAGCNLQPSLIFPQWLDGQIGPFSNSTTLVLRNNQNRTDKGRILFRDSMGEVSAIFGEIPYSLAPWALLEMQTPGVGSLQTGTIEIRSDLEEGSKIAGAAVLEVLGHSVAVPDAPARERHQVYVKISETQSVGLVFYNPDPHHTAAVDLLLLDEFGELVSSAELLLSPRQRFLGFVDHEQLFEGPLSGSTGEFRGTLNVTVSQGPKISVMGLVQEWDGTVIAIPTSGNALSPDDL